MFKKKTVSIVGDLSILILTFVPGDAKTYTRSSQNKRTAMRKSFEMR